MLSDLFTAFAQESPISVMVAGLLARLFPAHKLDQLFADKAEKQYTKTLLFSTLFDMMSLVVCRIRRSVHAAYQASSADMAVSITSVYNKLNATEIDISAELVRYSALAVSPIIEGLGGALPALLPGYHTKILDGHCLASSEHRLEELRYTNAGALPGKSLVVYDPSLKAVVDLFPCEDGHAQERSLLGQVLDRVQANELWIGDRNFCTLGFLLGVVQRSGFVLIREHKNLPWQALSALMEVGRSESGMVSEQRICIVQDEELVLRRIVLDLDEPTCDGDTQIVLLTNVERVSAIELAQIYRHRWSIEGTFQELEAHLSSEITTLGHPKAALFAFSVAIVAFNVLSVVKAALRNVHGHQKVEEEVSGYYIADEIAGTYRGMMIAIPWPQWAIFNRMTNAELVALLKDLARRVRLSAFKKHRRGPKKKPPEKQRLKQVTHLSTSKLLAQRKQRKKTP